MEILCSVCTDVLFGEPAIVSTSCCHVFHEDCIKNWISRSKTCPECRACLKNDTPRRLFFSSEPKDHTVARYFKALLSLRNEIKAQKEHFEEQLLAEVEIRCKLNEKLQTFQRRKAPPTCTVTSGDVAVVIPKNVSNSKNLSQEIVDLTQDSAPCLPVGWQSTVLESSNQENPKPRENNQLPTYIPLDAPGPSILETVRKKISLPLLEVAKGLPISPKRMTSQQERIDDGPTVKKSKP